MMTAQSPLHLCLDQGGSQSRALLYDQQGQLLHQVSEPVATQRPASDRVEQQPHELLASLLLCSQQLIAELEPQQRQRLQNWGLACQRSSLLCVDPQTMTPLTPVLSWQDCRGHRQQLWNSSQQRLLRQRTGLRPSHHHGASKLHWLLNNQIQLQQAAQQQRLLALPLASYLAACLSHSSPAVDPCNAQRTLLYNINNNAWDSQLFELFQLPRQLVPELRPCCAYWGALQIGSCHLSGRYVGADQGCALFADGKPKPGELKINLGSGGFVCLPISEQQHNQIPEQLLLSLAGSSSVESQWMVEGTINGAGSALHWWIDYERRLGQMLELQPFSTQPLPSPSGIFINAVSGLGSPYWRADIDSGFIDTHCPEQRFAAVVESILFLIYQQLQLLIQQQLNIERLSLSGGLVVIPGLAQRLANLCQRPVRQLQNSEATGRGLAYLLAGSPKHWPASPATDYQPQTDNALQQRYRRWHQELDQRLRQA